MLCRAACASIIPVLFLTGCRSEKPRAGGGPPSVPVSVAAARRQPMPVEVRGVGRVEPFSTIQVRSQIAGELVAVHFTEGGIVKKGDLLFEIDARPYREALRQAEATLAKDRAQLRQAQASLARDQAQARSATADSARYVQLAKEGMAPQTQADQARASADALAESIKADQAAIESGRALLDSDVAAVERARLDLGYCQIRSPVAGRAGTLMVNAGNLVKANDVALVVINQIEPTFVTFSVPERYLPSIREKSAGRKLEVVATLSTDASKTARGALQVIDNTVDATTGTIKLKALFDNSGRLLWPGQFVNLSLTLDTQADAVVVPAEAVQEGQRGPFVYVVKPDQTVDVRPVTVARTVGAESVIEKGVAEGETVVTDGQLLLFPGARIQPVPAGKVDSQAL